MVRWGLLGCGLIANDFVNGLKSVEEADVVACAARSADKAEAFAKSHGIKKSYGSYKELCADPEIDIVYVNTIHPYHLEHVTLALNSSKHVLVEKPFAMNYKQTKELVELARKKNLFLMEGMWTRFFPAVRKVRELVKEGAIGDVHSVQGDFGTGAWEEADRDWKKELGGGGLLDMGIYPLAFALMVFNNEKPVELKALGELQAEGVDAFGSFLIKFSKGHVANITYTTLARTRREYVIAGSKGIITIHDPAHAPEKITLQQFLPETKTITWEFPVPESSLHFNFWNSNGMQYEGKAVEECLKKGLKECPEYTLDESLRVASVMDQVRQQLGVVFPWDDSPAA